jgi:hypothetical protein
MEILFVAVAMLFVLTLIDGNLWPHIVPQARTSKRSRPWTARSLRRTVPRRRPQRPTSHPVPVLGFHTLRHSRAVQARWWWE